MASDSPSASFKLKEVIKFPCPFCGLDAVDGIVVEGPPETIGGEVVVHLEPQCSKFTEMDADAYRDAVTEEFARRRQS